MGIERCLTDTQQHWESLRRLDVASRIVFIDAQTFEFRQRLKIFYMATPDDWYYFSGGGIKREVAFKEQTPVDLEEIRSPAPLASPASPGTPPGSPRPSPSPPS